MIETVATENTTDKETTETTAPKKLKIYFYGNT